MDARYDCVKQCRQLLCESSLSPHLMRVMELELLRLSVLLLREEGGGVGGDGADLEAFSAIVEKAKALRLAVYEPAAFEDLLADMTTLVAALSEAESPGTGAS